MERNPTVEVEPGGAGVAPLPASMRAAATRTWHGVRLALTWSGTERLRRKVLARMVLAGSVLSLLLGGIVFSYEVGEAGGDLLAVARSESRALAAIAAEHLADERPDRYVELAHHVDLEVAHRGEDGRGFVRVQVFAASGVRVASASSEDAARAEAAFDGVELRRDPGRGFAHRLRVVDGQAYVRLNMPVSHAGQAPAGRLDAVFRASPSALRRVLGPALLTVASVVLSVLATTVLLVPIVLAMQRNLFATSRDLLRANLQGLEVVGSAIAKRDSDTHRHNYRVVVYSVRLAEAVGLAPEAIRHLIKGAFLHDVGKIAISDLILLKPGKLDPEEFETMKTHVEHGVDIVARSAWLAEAAEVVHYHHEKFDGSGYPEGLAGEAIPLTARIFAIADVFDALTSERPYKGAFSLEKTCWILEEGRGTHFDPVLLDAFLEIAPAVYAHFAGREDGSVDRAAAALVGGYFGLGAERTGAPAPGGSAAGLELALEPAPRAAAGR